LAHRNASEVSSINEPMKTRPVLDPSRIAPAAAEKLNAAHADTLDEIAKAIETHPIVVVGMAQNPHVKNVRNALKAASLDFHYLEYGSYFSEWKKRLTIKQWSGWPTFPQVFVRGVLIGGEDLTKAALADGTLQARATSLTGSAEAVTA
jgi:monothiol glutaredoxin